MIAVIFELEPREGQTSQYFDIAASLAPRLEEIDGFISIERFESVARPGKFVSLSFWRDESAIEAWRTLEEHRTAQAAGRGGILANYRLRVASVIRDYGLQDRDAAPADSRAQQD
ncbi:MAG: antibiotic biosynthesis monooxygenase [Chloroflexi bacterium]|nr:antibiotic biosynthesis monooxygenase [Chloroflexota bacterium]